MMDFAQARGIVTAHLEQLYAAQRPSPKLLAYGFDTGDAFAPMIDWDGVMGVYIHLVDKASGELTPLSFPQFVDMPDPDPVGSWPGQETNTALQVATTRTRDRITNHPGHSNQKSHGRKGGSGVRKALRDAKTTDELNAAAAQEAKRISGRDITFDMGGDLQVAKEHVEGVLRGLEKYPDVPLERVQHGMPRLYETLGALAMTDKAGTTISFSDRAQVAGAQAYRDRLTRSESAGDVVSGSPMGVGLHEFGHVLEVRTSSAATSMRTAQSMASSKGADTHDYIGERVSNYGTESAHELTAEAFADVMSFGSDASPLSRAIVDEVDRLYAGGRS